MVKKLKIYESKNAFLIWDKFFLCEIVNKQIKFENQLCRSFNSEKIYINKF